MLLSIVVQLHTSSSTLIEHSIYSKTDTPWQPLRVYSSETAADLLEIFSECYFSLDRHFKIMKILFNKIILAGFVQNNLLSIYCIVYIGKGFSYLSLLCFFCQIFFVLRKKENQISFLHVYHHISMCILWWTVVKWNAG